MGLEKEAWAVTAKIAQITDLSGQTLTWDADGNLTSDGARTYTWDAENRLIGINYPGVSGKATAFTYDGLSRRVAIASTPSGGGSTVTTSYLWCGSAICQARNASNTTTREYLSEGEYVPGTTPQPYYYGSDQIGSVRRVFASTSSAPAFSYDPYGVPLQTTTPTTDFTYAGMFFNADSGLDLTLYRAYDPIAGRWLSRDPIGEASNPVGNLYPYVNGDPVSNIDPRGDNPIVGAEIGAELGTMVSPGAGTIVGGLVGIGIGLIVGETVYDRFFNKAPDLPTGLVGDNPRPSSGKRTNTDLPASQFPETAGDLTGGELQDLPGGGKICPNGVRIRPGPPGEGPRIDIPGNGPKPPETIHFPPGTPWPW